MSPRHYLHVFQTFCAAGPQVRAAALMRAFGAGIRHTVVSMDGQNGAAELAGDADIKLSPYAPGAGPGASLRFFRRLIKREKPDLLLSYNWGAIEAPMAARGIESCPVVHHEDGFNHDEVKRLKLRRNWARSFVLRKTDVIVPSRKLEKIARDTWHLQKLHFIANGIDARAFEKDAALGAAFRESMGIASDEVLVGAVGHLRPVKNLGRLIRAVSELGDRRVRLVLAGDGAERGNLEALAARLGLPVVFTGHLRELRGAYSAFDVFAISSDSEQQPVALLEAMAASLPVCATDVGDIAVTLPESARENLVASAPAAHVELAGVLRRMIEDPERRRALGDLNRHHVVEHFSEESMLAAYAKVYEAARTG